jgi:hypothetical protein
MFLQLNDQLSIIPLLRVLPPTQWTLPRISLSRTVNEQLRLGPPLLGLTEATLALSCERNFTALTARGPVSCVEAFAPGYPSNFYDKNVTLLVFTFFKVTHFEVQIFRLQFHVFVVKM